MTKCQVKQSSSLFNSFPELMNYEYELRGLPYDTNALSQRSKRKSFDLWEHNEFIENQSSRSPPWKVHTYLHTTERSYTLDSNNRHVSLMKIVELFLDYKRVQLCEEWQRKLQKHLDWTLQVEIFFPECEWNIKQAHCKYIGCWQLQNLILDALVLKLYIIAFIKWVNLNSLGYFILSCQSL